MNIDGFGPAGSGQGAQCRSGDHGSGGCGTT